MAVTTNQVKNILKNTIYRMSEENIDHIPEDNKPESPKEIIIHLTEIPAISAIEQPITINPKPETETMEVHHHP